MKKLNDDSLNFVGGGLFTNPKESSITHSPFCKEEKDKSAKYESSKNKMSLSTQPS